MKKKKKNVEENHCNRPNNPPNKDNDKNQINNKNTKCFSFIIFLSHFLCLFIGLMVPICSDKLFHHDLNDNKIIEEKNKIIIGLDFGSTQSGYKFFMIQKLILKVKKHNL